MFVEFFLKNRNKTVGGVCDTNLLVFCTQTNTQIHRHMDRRTG